MKEKPLSEQRIAIRQSRSISEIEKAFKTLVNLKLLFSRKIGLNELSFLFQRQIDQSSTLVRTLRGFLENSSQEELQAFWSITKIDLKYALLIPSPEKVYLDLFLRTGEPPAFITKGFLWNHKKVRPEHSSYSLHLNFLDKESAQDFYELLQGLPSSLSCEVVNATDVRILYLLCAAEIEYAVGHTWKHERWQVDDNVFDTILCGARRTPQHKVRNLSAITNQGNMSSANATFPSMGLSDFGEFIACHDTGLEITEDIPLTSWLRENSTHTYNYILENLLSGTWDEWREEFYLLQERNVQGKGIKGDTEIFEDLNLLLPE